MSDERPGATPAGGFEFNRPTIVGLLYLGSILTGFSGLVGLVLAIVWKGEAHEPWEATHYSYLIRTFVIGLIVGVIGVILSIVVIGFLILFALAIWYLVRTVMSLVNAQKRAPMPDPTTLLF